MKLRLYCQTIFFTCVFLVLPSFANAQATTSCELTGCGHFVFVGQYFTDIASTNKLGSTPFTTYAVGNGITGTSTGAFVSADFTGGINWGLNVSVQYQGYFDANYTSSDASSTCAYNASGSPAGVYKSDGSMNPDGGSDKIDISQLMSGVATSTCIFIPTDYYLVTVEYVFSANSLYFTGTATYNGTASTTSKYPVWESAPNVFQTSGEPYPYFAIVGNGFTIADSGNIVVNGFGGVLAQACNLPIFGGSGSIPACAYSLVVPDKNDIALIGQTLYQGLLLAYPWGMITRIVAIATETSTSTLPVVVITSPTTVNGNTFPVQGKSLSFDLWSALPGSGNSIWDTTTSPDGKTFREVAEPYWDSFVIFCFALSLIPTIMGISLGVHEGDTGGGSRGYDNETALTGSEITLTRRAQYQAKFGGGKVSRKRK